MSSVSRAHENTQRWPGRTNPRRRQKHNGVLDVVRREDADDVALSNAQQEELVAKLLRIRLELLGAAASSACAFGSTAVSVHDAASLGQRGRTWYEIRRSVTASMRAGLWGCHVRRSGRRPAPPSSPQRPGRRAARSNRKVKRSSRSGITTSGNGLRKAAIVILRSAATAAAVVAREDSCHWKLPHSWPRRRRVTDVGGRRRAWTRCWICRNVDSAPYVAGSLSDTSPFYRDAERRRGCTGGHPMGHTDTRCLRRGRMRRRVIGQARAVRVVAADELHQLHKNSRSFLLCDKP